jgi:2-aminoadipate transaminase
MLAKASEPDILSLALGLPAADLFPSAAIAESVNNVLAANPRALQYGPPSHALKCHIVKLMAKRGVACTAEDVFLTAGAQQGLNLIARLLLCEGSQVVVEELTYPGFLQVLEPFQPRILTIPVNTATGMDVERLEAILRSGCKPELIYAILEGHNPLGVSMPMEGRTRLVHLARKYQVPVIEDDPYGFLSYDDAPAPPLRALDDQWVVYVGSFSKLLAPALRVGWLVAPRALMPKLSIVKEATDIDTATFTQRVVTDYLDRGLLEAHLEGLRREYRARRNAMLAALDQQFSGLARWAPPSSGFFVWVQFAEAVRTQHLLQTALATEKVAFLPGSAFSTAASPQIARNCARLNFSALPCSLIREGAGRLARCLETMKNQVRQ